MQREKKICIRYKLSENKIKLLLKNRYYVDKKRFSTSTNRTLEGKFPNIFFKNLEKGKVFFLNQTRKL